MVADLGAEVLVAADSEAEDLVGEDLGVVVQPLDLEVELAVHPLDGLDPLE